jgi:hypothetical protein
MRSAGRLLVTLPVIGVLAWASLAAFGVGISDVLVREAHTEIATWAARRVIPHQSTWESVRLQVKEAEREQPRNPASHEILGFLGTLWTDAPDRMAEGSEELVTALRYRPVSPFTWAGIVQARYRAGKSGRELEIPIMRAAELGPAEPGVQRVVADFGLAVWNEITPEIQTVVDRIVAAGMYRNPMEMLQISERRGRLDVACRHLADSSRKVGSQADRLCPSWELTP